MFKLKIEGEGLNFGMDIGNNLAKSIIGMAIDKRFAPKTMPMPPITPPVAVVPESEPEHEQDQDGEPL